MTHLSLLQQSIADAKGKQMDEPLPREPEIEAALSWAAQQSYSFAYRTIKAYCDKRNLTYTDDPMYGYVTFKEKE